MMIYTGGGGGTHLKIIQFWEKTGGQFDGKIQEIHEKLSKSGKINCFANVLENIDIARFVSIFFKEKRVIRITFCYTAEKHCKSGKRKT